MDHVETAGSMMRLGLGAKAWTSTEEAPVLASGGFVGLTWEGTTSDGAPLRGTGFREYAHG